jgi:uncharacterized protein YbbC (DUF1343 family)
MVYSLYSETRVPTEEMVDEIDTFVVDLQDVGCRIYTYTYTMAYCMQAAAKYGKRVIVCDRPNPINGVTIEGNVTEKEFTSFVGQFELPTRPGMTIGEMAKMFNEHWNIGCDLEVVEMTGWEREMSCRAPVASTWSSTPSADRWPSRRCGPCGSTAATW